VRANKENYQTAGVARKRDQGEERERERKRIITTSMAFHGK
jgi:hypothetical protein